jgi:putative ATP-dependent endonuclease of OLD family
MYLHPQAQRYFYRLLCEMTESKQCQVIYSTHSPIFADVNRFEALRVVRRPAKASEVAYVKPENVRALERARDAFKLGGRFDPARNEVLFARRALLVEGYGDRVAALIVAEKLGFDTDAEALAIVDCGGKAGIELIVGVCQALSIPFFVLHDEDVWPIDQDASIETKGKLEEENRSAAQMNDRIRKAVGNDTKLFIVRPTLEQVLGIGRDAKDKPRRIAEELQKVDVQKPGESLGPVVNAVQAMWKKV